MRKSTLLNVLGGIEEREIQKQNHKDVEASSLVDGFATLFLNRVNFSGIAKMPLQANIFA